MAATGKARFLLLRSSVRLAATSFEVFASEILVKSYTVISQAALFILRIGTTNRETQGARQEGLEGNGLELDASLVVANPTLSSSLS